MNHKGRVLIIDDEKNILSSLNGILSDEGYLVSVAEDGKGALEVIESNATNLVLLDIWIPGMDGLQVLKTIKSSRPDIEIIIMSGHGSIDTAVKATKLGAFDFIEKPLSLENVLLTVRRAMEQQKVNRRTRRKNLKIQRDNIKDGKKMSMKQSEESEKSLKNDTRVILQSRTKKYKANAIDISFQRTLKQSVVLCGHGLHSGIKTGLILSPLPVDSGIIFEDISTGEQIHAHIANIESTAFATSLKKDYKQVRTVEHIMAVLHMYRIHNLLIKVGDEVPIMDGSAIDFCQLIEDGGVEEQNGFLDEIIIKDRIAVHVDSSKSIVIEPHPKFCVKYTLNYPSPVGRQEYTFTFKDEMDFKKNIAPARTFGFLKDFEKLEEMGFAGGGKLSNLILLDNEKVINTPLRFPDEFVRHKILDIIGDFYLLGRPIRGKISAIRTGHTEDISLLGKIRGQYNL